MSRILLLEDHERLAQLICKGLRPAGIAVDVFSRIDHALDAINQVPYQALVIDRGLPDGDGLSLIKRLRSQANALPCLVLTARNALHDRVEGLDSGADDYLSKPFAMEEMVARVKALLRRPAASQPLVAHFGDLALFPETSLIQWGESSEQLAPAELQILLLLMRKQGDVARHSALESAGWGLADAVTPNALDVAIHRLRRKLAALGCSIRIVNIRGIGYALSDTGKI